MRKSEIWKKAMDVWDNEAKTISCLPEIIDIHNFIKCVKIIKNCKGKIATAGLGTSAAAAKKIAHSLSCIERPSFFLSCGDAVHGGLGSVQSNDVAILISKGGNTREIINIVPTLKTKKVYIIGVTENEDSTLAQNCDLLIKVKIKKEADNFNMLATSSTLAVISVFDAICIILMSWMNYTKEQFAIIHPEGAVGERLLKEKR